jgi:hypothetical protein
LKSLFLAAFSNFVSSLFAQNRQLPSIRPWGPRVAPESYPGIGPFRQRQTRNHSLKADDSDSSPRYRTWLCGPFHCMRNKIAITINNMVYLAASAISLRLSRRRK